MSDVLVIHVLQAILPLRGKILNIERKDEAAMYKNEEIQNLILGLGLGVKVLCSSLRFVLCVHLFKILFSFNHLHLRGRILKRKLSVIIRS